jgi:hypothetical protein
MRGTLCRASKPGIKDVSLARQVNFEPSAEVHRRRVRGDADVAEVSRAVAGGEIETAEGNREMSEIAADAAALVVSIPCGPERTCMLVPEFEAVMNVIADGLNPSPAGPCAAK